MKAVLTKGNGDADVLYVDHSVPVPEIKAGEILVRVHAFGINRMDITQRQGNYPPPPGCSDILGVEFAGIIEKSSEESLKEGFKAGDKVFGLAGGGCYAEFVATSSRQTFHLPDEISFEQAAGIPEVWLTAYQVVKFVGKFREGMTILFHGGTSGVGLAVVQLAQLLGAKQIFATVGSDSKKDFLTSKVRLEGVNTLIIPINYKKENFAQVVKHHCPQGVDLVIDPIGKSHFNNNITAVGLDGRIVVMGALSGSVVDNVSIRDILVKRIHIVGTTLRTRSLEYKRHLRDEVERVVVRNAVKGKLNLFIEKVFQMSEIAKAHKLLESNTTMGKVIVTV